jgi:hypothetical protein
MISIDSSSGTPFTVSSHDIIRKIQPAVIPRISSISHMALCERAAYNIDFLGMQSAGDFTASGEIGNAVHRVVIKSTLEIVDSIRKAKGSPISKPNAIDLFRTNAIDDVDVNWKRFVLAGIERPLPSIMEDLDIRAERVVNDLLLPYTDNSNRKKKRGEGEPCIDRYERLILRPEFTIRNLDIPLEGRLDLVKIKLTKPVTASDKEEDNMTNRHDNMYVASDHLAHLRIEDVEII